MVYYDLSYKHLSGASILKRALAGFFTWMFIPVFGFILVSSLLFLSLGLLNLAWMAILIISVTIICFCFSVFVQWLYFLRFKIVLENDVLRIEEGWLMHRELAIPVEMIDDIIMEEDSFDRWRGMATLHILSKSDIVLPIGAIDGLTLQQAITLRDMLLAIKKNEPIIPANMASGQNIKSMLISPNYGLQEHSQAPMH